jgi:hypothetical protein
MAVMVVTLIRGNTIFKVQVPGAQNTNEAMKIAEAQNPGARATSVDYK